MKKIITVSVALVCCYLTSSAQTSVKKSLADFEWLLGKWERINNKSGQITYEKWIKESDTKFIGFDWTMKGKDTVFIENFSLEIKDNDLYYIADVSHNPAPVPFKITVNSTNGFTSSNPEHDFPKKIEYKKENGNTMTATISGNGKEIPYKFKKVE